MVVCYNFTTAEIKLDAVGLFAIFSPNIAVLSKPSSGEDIALSWFPIVPAGITFDNEITGRGRAVRTMAELFRTWNGVESLLVLCHALSKGKLAIRSPTFHFHCITCAVFSRVIDVHSRVNSTLRVMEDSFFFFFFFFFFPKPTP